MADIALGKVEPPPPPAEVPEMDLYHSHSWWTTYVFSQDAKVIAIQYSLSLRHNLASVTSCGATTAG